MEANMNKFLPLTLTLLAMFLANATAKTGVFHAAAAQVQAR